MIRTLAAVALIALPALSFQDPVATPARVRVHEWGTFTTVSGGSGAALEWRPLAGPSDLPSFVHTPDREARRNAGYRNRNLKGMKATVRMETPVLYFYADRETELSVKVGFPGGRITEWYPQAHEAEGGIDWGRIRILPGAKVAFPVEPAPSHYYPARETDADPVRVCPRETDSTRTEYEKFLFYRGVGTFGLPLQATLDGNSVRLANTGEAIAQAVLFENRDGRIAYSISCDLRKEAVMERSTEERTIAALEADLLKILLQQGLYEKEALAMIKTWRDSWFEPGLRIFYVLPRAATDKVLPIAIEPAPAELVRVMVGRLEILTPEREREIAALVAQLGDPAMAVRDEASRKLALHGRFAEPVLRTLLARETDPEIKVRIEKLLQS